MVAGRGWLRPGGGQAPQELDTAHLAIGPGRGNEGGVKNGAIPGRPWGCTFPASAGGNPLATEDTEGGLGRGETAMQKPPQMAVQGHRAGGVGAAGIGGELRDGNDRRISVQGLSSLDRHREEGGRICTVASGGAAASGGANEPGGLSPRAEEAGGGRAGGVRPKRARGGSRRRLESEDSCDDQQSTPPRWSPESGPTQRKRFKWTPEEESLLCATVSKFGSSDWQAIQKVTYLGPPPVSRHEPSPKRPIFLLPCTRCPSRTDAGARPNSMATSA